MSEIIKTLLESGKNLSQVFPEMIEMSNGDIELTRASSGADKEPLKKTSRDKLRENGWPPNCGTYEIRDPMSPVAVVCPAQNAELQTAAIFYGAAISGPCITPDRGVELVITNIISNPNIRWIILAGKDSGHFAGDVILSIWKNGVDKKTRRVLDTKCPTNPYLMNIPWEAIERFRQQVKVINLMAGYKKEEMERMKLELGLLIRCCIQEKENPIKLRNKKTNEELILCDQGSEDFEPIIVDLKLKKIGAYYEGYNRVGTTIHVSTVSEAYPVAMSHVVNMGSFGKQESTRMALDTVATQIVIHDTANDLVPSGWRPFGWIQDDATANDYIEKYRLWVYLFPLSDVKYDREKKKFIPYIPEQMEYAYGGRLTAYWYELAEEQEKKAVKDLVGEYHHQFQDKNPTFEQIVEFYERLAKIQKKSFNQIYHIAKAVKLCVQEGFSASYRNYMSLQTPPIDIKADPRQTHNPCFALYEVYPRQIKARWQLDCCFFLRAHDIMAFPANTNGGIMLQKFLAWYAGIDQGIYVHHAGSLEVCDYMLDKETLEKHKDKG